MTESLQSISPEISIINYNKENIEEQQIQSIDEIQKFKNNNSITWVIIEGLADIDTIDSIDNMFDIHPLTRKNILSNNQRAKFKEHNDYLYISLPCLHSVDEEFRVHCEVVHLLVLKDFVVLFKEKQNTLFHPLQKQMMASQGRLRSRGTDYLTYAILNTIIEQNIKLVDSLDETFISIEDTLLNSDVTQETLNSIQKLRRGLININRDIKPVSELISGMLRSESKLIDENTHIYLRDISDNAARAIESVDLYRESLSGLLDLYASIVSNKMNEIMKVLTIFASIFIPLTFIAGIYGMNFEYMPELKWRWAYPAIWGIFILITIMLLAFFRKKKWL